MARDKRPFLLKLLMVIFIIGSIFLAFILYLPSSASLATFTVNSTSDTDDGTCDGAHCSLREAINAANVAGGADTINFSLLPNATITLTTSQLPTIIDTLTIDGSTADNLIISGNTITRTFQIGSGTAVTLTALTLKNGEAIYGGAIHNDGGSLHLFDTTLLDNTAAIGAGIYNNDGTLFISDSTLLDNSANSTGGGIANTSGGTVTISDSFFSGNRAEVWFGKATARGGAIFNEGTVTIVDSTLRTNWAWATDMSPFPSFSAVSYGGAVANEGILIVRNSTINNNGVVAAAPYLSNNGHVNSAISGGDYFAVGGGISNSSMLIVSNSTISGNKATVALTFNESPGYSSATASGAGIINGSGTMTITNSTFTGNSSTLIPTDGIPVGTGTGGIDNSGTMSMMNTIVANSDESDDCVNSGTILVNISNMVEDGGCSPALTGDPLLGPLVDNGGPTWTHALTAPSPAVDAGDDAVCAAPPISNLDQRGVTRPIDGDGDGVPRCDIGAYEYDGPPPDRSYLSSIFRY